jgi:type 1 glutamine amidotransferase
MKLNRVVRLIAITSLFLAAQHQLVQCAEPIRALLITGGGSHDYKNQKNILTEGISARANVNWTISYDGVDDATHEATVYSKPDWWKGYDIIVHDECYGKVTNLDLVKSCAAAQADGVPAVVLHASIHSYRFAKTDDWRKVLGVSSLRHQRARAFDVTNLKPENPVMKGFPATWHDFPDELYEIIKVWPNCTPLAEGHGTNNSKTPVIWLNTANGTRVFGTTIGHGNETVKSDVYLDLVTRGLLWACNKLNDDGKPMDGYGPIKKND